MKIEDIKKKMHAYTDIFGGELLGKNDINACKTKQELEDILWRHESFMEDQLADAKSSLSKFKETLGL